MSENEREFKGVWIPKVVWLDKRLNALDKVILTEIDSLDMGERGCFASNKHIAEFCQCSETKVSKSVSLLIKLGYIYVQKFDGRQRELKSRLSNFENLPCKKDKADFSKRQDSNTSNSTGTNTVNNNILTEFEELWKLYPRKIGKPKALKAYQKARKNGTTFEDVQQGLEMYLRQIEAQNTSTEYIKHGSTWFNGECWNDEYNTAPKKTDAKKEAPNEYNNFMAQLAALRE